MHQNLCIYRRALYCVCQRSAPYCIHQMGRRRPIIKFSMKYSWTQMFRHCTSIFSFDPLQHLNCYLPDGFVQLQAHKITKEKTSYKHLEGVHAKTQCLTMWSKFKEEETSKTVLSSRKQQFHQNLGKKWRDIPIWSSK